MTDTKTLLTGIQPTGIPHLGNILGAILPTINLVKNYNKSYLFVADLHSITQIKDSELLKKNNFDTACVLLACGLDIEKTTIFLQSDVPQVTELSWYFSCFFPYNRLKLAHSFKDKKDRLEDINAGLFVYPILMAADILLYDADVVPVGHDQKQHLEFTRDIAIKFNNIYGNILNVPTVSVQEKTKLIVGIDGEKMSKSRNNTINVFDDDKELKKTIMKIITDDTPLESPKNFDKCNVAKIYSSIANLSQIAEMKAKYEGGNYGYGHAKKELLELIINHFADIRKKYIYYQSNPEIVNDILKNGAIEANKKAQTVLNRVRSTLGFNNHIY